MTALGSTIAACGPVIDAAAAARSREALAEAARGAGWAEELDAAWPALAPIFSASPYLAGLARRAPDPLRRVLADDPGERLEAILAGARACAEGGAEAGERGLRDLKAELHLLTALADLGGVWTLEAVTGALSAFADAALASAMGMAAGEALAAGRLTRLGVGDEGPAPGLFAIAMGKHGAFELNYSSDIDISVFYEPAVLPLASGIEAAPFAIRLVERIADILQRRTVEGYVFRVDLRLRPDPSSTPVAVPVAAAFDYYESVGQNWERAAFIKARVAAGDMARGAAFLGALAPFIWRRNLDFAAIADIHSIKRQIHVHKADDRLAARGADLKLGRGGIREIEFYVQTQQLILGGRHGALRSPRTLDALSALADAGHVARQTAEEMAGAYRTLRGLEHRAQMIGDEQTHRLPAGDPERRRIAALAGYGDLRAFDAAVGRLLKGVNRRYGELFAGEEALSSRFGSLVFTGVDDDPETLATLRRMGFSDPGQVSATIRAWHHGRIAATRSERGREVFTRLAPRLLEAARATGAPDAAFARFADFFTALSSGVQVQSLFLAQPRLFELVVRITALAPRFARTLARRPAALDALLDPSFFSPIAPPLELPAAIAAADSFEAAMDVARRLHRERAFRIGVQVLGGVADAREAGPAFADLADALIEGLAQASLHEVERAAGPFPGETAVIALGKCGSREMTAASDLDLMTLYRPLKDGATSAGRDWSAETFYARFTQRLVTALAAPTAEGELYEVDLQLRPSGTKGPVAVSLAAFESYYGGEADPWEFLALTRARVIWATSSTFAKAAADAIEAVLRRPRDPAVAGREVRDMRALMAQERAPSGFWDMKLIGGGLVDIEFAAQYLQLIHAGAGGPLRQNTADALDALGQAALAPPGVLELLRQAWALQQNLSQLLKVAIEDDADPAGEPAALRALLCRAGDTRRFADLKARLVRARKAAHGAFRYLVSSRATDAGPASVE
ncbi:MAG: bifunctional [glutamine synthetase] adenylyltransferase/[glutamine synthetase]-adenylyl-L-tyrosine phosphorylase [Caulobacteraceae bacterium]